MERIKSSRTAKVKGLFRRGPKPSSTTPQQHSHMTPEPTSIVPPEKTNPSLSLVQVDSKLSDMSLTEESPEPDMSHLDPVPGKKFSVDIWKQARQVLNDKEKQLLDGCQDDTDGGAVLVDLQKLANEKRRETEARAWKIDFGGRRIVMKEVAGKIASWTKTFTDIGDTLVQLDPMHAGLPWAVVKMVLQVVTADQTQMGLILIGLEQVTCLTTRSKLYQRLYLDNIEPRSNTHADVMKGLVDNLVRLYAKLFSFLAYYVRLLDKSGPSSALRAFIKPDELSDMLSDIGTYEQRVSTAADLCEKEASVSAIERTDQNFKDTRLQLRELMSRLDLDMVQFWKKLNEDERCKILQWVSDIPYESDHYIARNGRVDGTGEWLLQHEAYKAWRETQGSTILWLNGIPGAGKTKLSSKVVDNLLPGFAADADENRAFAYFYCDRNRTDHRDPVALLRSLVRQLCAPQDNSVIEACVEAKYEQRRRKGFARDRLMSEECHDLLMRLVSAFAETYLVIDGLDECDRETRHVLMDTVDEIVAKSSHPVKIYIASRTDTDLRKRYEGRNLLEVTANKNQADIETFVLKKMEHSDFCRKKMSSKVRDQVLTTFRNKSQGMFQWAMLHIRDLLELKRNNDILKYLDELPRGLEATYDNIYQQISSQIGSKKEIAFSAFKILMVSTRPLSPHELVIAVTQDPETDFCIDEDIDIDYVLEACYNLLVVADGSLERPAELENKSIEVDYKWMGGYQFQEIGATTLGRPTIGDKTEMRLVSSTSICKFSHLSVQEYLESKHWGIQEANAFMAGICLRTLLCLCLSDAPNNPTGRQSVDSKGEENDIDEAPLLSVGHTERMRKLGIIWNHEIEDDAQEAASEEQIPAEDSKGGENSNDHFEPPPFQCFCELVHIHTHRDDESCISADFDPYIDGYKGTAVENWIFYAAQAFALHTRRAYDESGNASICDDLLSQFLGNAETSSSHYQAWALLNQTNQDTAMESSNSAQESSAEYASRSLMRPTSNPAFGCAMLGLHQVLESWLENGRLDPNCTNKNGDSLLVVAIQNSHQQTCKILLQHGADPNRRGSRQLAPLDIAVEKRQAGLVLALLNHGANPNLPPTEESDYPLTRAVRLGDLEITTELLQHGADCTLSSPQSFEYTPLVIASMKLNVKLVSLILEHVSKQSYWKYRGIVWKALEDIASVGDSAAEIVKLLMGHMKELKVSSSLHIAMKKGNWGFANALIENGADVDMQGADGDELSDTPLLYLVKGDYGEILQKTTRLLDWGADVNAKDLHGRTPLFLCVQNCMSYTYDLSKDKDGEDSSSEKQPLENEEGKSKSEESRAEVIKLLLSRGADPNARDRKNTTVLVTACLSQMITPPVLQMLIDSGARVNDEAGSEYEFMTPLDAAGLHTEVDDEHDTEKNNEDDDQGDKASHGQGDESQENDNFQAIIDILCKAGAKYTNERRTDEQRSVWRRIMKKDLKIRTKKLRFT